MKLLFLKHKNRDSWRLIVWSWKQTFFLEIQIWISVKCDLSLFTHLIPVIRCFQRVNGHLMLHHVCWVIYMVNIDSPTHFLTGWLVNRSILAGFIMGTIMVSPDISAAGTQQSAWVKGKLLHVCTGQIQSVCLLLTQTQ